MNASILNELVSLRNNLKNIISNPTNDIIKDFISSVIFKENRGDFSRSVYNYAFQISYLLDQVPQSWSAYFIGTLYTHLLDPKYKSKNGIFYTPPVLVDNLLNTLESNGVDWITSKILDPACGGGAFLVPITERIIKNGDFKNPENLQTHLRDNLRGVDKDYFGTWLSEQLLRKYLKSMYPNFDFNLNGIINYKDTLTINSNEKYDVIVGNPPYGKISLDEKQRARFKESLYGHANLYGLFSHQGINLLKPSGCLAYVMPASFLGGKYFKNLRHMFLKKCPPIALDFVKSRDGVFPDVLQEVCIAYYRKNACPRPYVKVKYLNVSEQTQIEHTNGKSHLINGINDLPWYIPRSPQQEYILEKASQMSIKLNDLGYKVSTGPLVWNRHKPRLHKLKKNNAVPVIWAECVNPGNRGKFRYKCQGKNHSPWYIPSSTDDPNVTNKNCLLVQRTTAIEQDRRLIAAELPLDFINQYPNGVAIENHLNMVLPVKGVTPVISLKTINYLLNSEVVDLVFRCINGSTAVSAYELESIPFPSIKELLYLEKLVEDCDDKAIFDFIIELYTTKHDITLTVHSGNKKTA